ncbi:hypothetical protein AK88_05390 [Plasmodium fragile]|uniref:Schizont-infected cell agglutination extracellular alpha domain-containing protein n=1 Tax=Plasmodium fragile TaxID=5857 RepID=A0A0D9QD42_PLAFR|nr:uncharacterized protein AK88_05390 [Plasmodium fragile]KJP84980.1 hypothetical protein AK88_05390 [Plasmodium fragile]
MESVLNDFVHQMESLEDSLDMYAISCEHTGWVRRGREKDGAKYTGHTVGDVMKCRLMVGALFFIPGWSNPMHNDKDPSANNTAMKAIMRCIVANVFMYILAAIPCGHEWLGPDWAWHIMRNLAVGTGAQSNPIFNGTCELDEYKDTNIGTGNLQEAVKQWLQQSRKISASIKAIQKHPKCNIPWGQYKKEMEARGEAADSFSMFKEEGMQGLVKKQMQDMFKTITKTVRKKVEKARKRVEVSVDSPDSDVESEDEEEQKKSTVHKEQPLNGKSPATKTIVPTGGGGQKEEKDTRRDAENMNGKASTLGTSSGNGTSQYGTEVGTTNASTVGTTTVSLSDGTDVGTRGTRNFYDGRATDIPVKNTVFDDMRRNFKSKVKVQKPNHVKKSSQDITAGNNCRRGLKTLIRCKMGRKTWSILIVVFTVLYSSFMSIMQQLMSWGFPTGIADFFSPIISMYGIPILIPIIYLCVLVCFCCSKTGKCLLDKMWKKKEKDESPTETKNNEGEVNKKQEALKEPVTFQKQEGPTKKEAPGTAGVPKKLEAPKKTEYLSNTQENIVSILYSSRYLRDNAFIRFIILVYGCDNMSYETLGKLLAKYVLKRGIGADGQAYTQTLWKDVEALLDKFVEYLEDEEIDIYASNCLNAGYRSLRKPGILMVQKVADRLMCTLMSRALFFMNRWPRSSGVSHETEDENAALKEYIRCAIVNIFMHILNASVCRSQMGIHYAWETVTYLQETMPGLIKQGKWRMGVFTDIKIQELEMGENIKAWLIHNGRVTGQVGGNAMKSTCRKRIHELVGATPDAHAMLDNTDLRPEEEEAIRELGHELKVIVEHVKTEVVQCARENGVSTHTNEDATSTDIDDDVHEATAPNSVAGGTPAPPLGSGPQPSTPDPPTPANTTPEKPNKGPVAQHSAAPSLSPDVRPRR